MKHYIAFFMFISTASLTQADNLMNYVEYKIPSNDLLAFSSSGVRIKTCELCTPSSISFTPNVKFIDRNETIDLKKATELYMKKPYPFISIYIDRTKKQSDMIRFGGFDELYTPPTEKSKK